MNKPLVSIICTAYNHENYIQKCIDGFMMQRTSFEFEVLINEDASTDNTACIIKEYEIKNPKIIKPIYQTENQYSKRAGIWRNILFPRAQGKYIAICEGDDCWTDPYKLQKQVDFLETHKDYILVCGGFKSIGRGEEKDEILTSIVASNQEDKEGFSFTLNDCRNAWLTKTLTTLFRNGNEISQYSEKYNFSTDVHLFYHLLRSGKGYYMKQVLGIYNKHAGGVYSLKSRQDKILSHYNLYKDLYDKSPDEFTGKKYLDICLDVLNLKISLALKEKKIKLVSLLLVFLQLASDKSDLIHLLKSLIPIQIKTLLHRRSMLET